MSTKWAHAGGRVTAPTFSLTTGVFFEPDTTSGVWLAQLHGPRAQVNSHQGPGVGVHAGVNHMAVSIRSSDLCGFGLEVGDRDLAWHRPVGGVLLLFFMPVLPARGVQNRALNHTYLFQNVLKIGITLYICLRENSRHRVVSQHGMNRLRCIPAAQATPPAALPDTSTARLRASGPVV